MWIKKETVNAQLAKVALKHDKEFQPFLAMVSFTVNNETRGWQVQH